MPVKARHMAPLAALVLSASVAVAAPPADATARAAAPAGLERLKALAGEWVSAEDGEMAKKGALVARYGVTASGSAVVETVFPGSAHEMVTDLVGPDEIRNQWTEMAGGKVAFVAKTHLVRKTR